MLVPVVSGGADMLADWFTDSGDWAQTIYDNVETLLSISQLPGIGADTLGFIGVMGGIGAGLLAFAAAGTGTSMFRRFKRLGYHQAKVEAIGLKKSKTT